jgi:hypothetical protein
MTVKAVNFIESHSSMTIDLVFGGKAYPVPKTCLAEFLQHRRSLVDAKSYSVQSSIPVVVFGLFVNSLKTQTKMPITADNAVPLFLLAKEFSLASILAECSTFPVPIAQFCGLSERFSRLERQMSSLSKPLRQLEDELGSQDRGLEALRSALGRLDRDLGDQVNQLKRDVEQLKASWVSARPSASPQPKPAATPPQQAAAPPPQKPTHAPPQKGAASPPRKAAPPPPQQPQQPPKPVTYPPLSGWAAYLAPLNGVAEGSAVLSLLQGARRAQQGTWLASTAEEQLWASYWKALWQATGKGLFYNRKKNIVIHAVDDSILASCRKEGLILQKAKTVFIAARYIEGQVPNAVSAVVAVIVQKLISAGC